MDNTSSSEDKFCHMLFALIFLLFSLAVVEQFAGDAGQYLVVSATVIALGIIV